MIATNCMTCCFFNKYKMQGTGCIAGQFCVTNNDKTWAPGCCRMSRSKQWAKITSNNDLIKAAREEISLRFSLLVLFNEHIHTLEDLQLTIGTLWYQGWATEIIVADTTGSKNRHGLSTNVFKSHTNKRKINDDIPPLFLDISSDTESPDKMEETVRRISQKIHDKLFMVIPAGQKCFNILYLWKHIKLLQTRVLMWKLPIWVGDTPVSEINTPYGLYLTEPYKTVIQKNNDKSFRKQLAIEEEETGIELSLTCTECGLTNKVD